MWILCSKGWFPAKFVEVLDERSKEYSRAGDDAISATVTDLVRGTLCPAVKAILQHGMRSTSLLGKLLGGKEKDTLYIFLYCNPESPLNPLYYVDFTWICGKQKYLCLIEVNGEQQWFMNENDVVLFLLWN